MQFMADRTNGRLSVDEIKARIFQRSWTLSPEELQSWNWCDSVGLHLPPREVVPLNDFKPDSNPRVRLAEALRRAATAARNIVQCQNQVLQATNSANSFLFFGEVNKTSVNAAKTFLSRCWQNRVKDIDFYVNSPGGDIIEGLSLCEMINSMCDAGVNINMIGVGMQASMGSILMQFGRRIMGKHSRMMIHRASSLYSGTAAQMMDQQTFVRKYEDRIFGLLSRPGGLSVADLKEMTKRQDVWLTPAEAEGYKLIDETR